MLDDKARLTKSLNEFLEVAIKLNITAHREAK